MNILLTADLHLTDNPLDEYRWSIFESLKDVIVKNNVDFLGILGDMFDRKDRHTGNLVNRVVDELYFLQSTTGIQIEILSGNHDAPLKGRYFWEFLNKYPNIQYVTRPFPFFYQSGSPSGFKGEDKLRNIPNTVYTRCIWILPYSANPEKEWKELPLYEGFAIFMHQPIQGALIDEKRKLDKAPPLPPLPDVPIFSGDIHNGQDLTFSHENVTNKVTYIGVPYPVHFNENWKNRLLLIKDDDFDHPVEIWVEGTKRAILDIQDTSTLDLLPYKEGDQVRIRYQLSGESITKWSEEEEKIRKWALDRGIHLASVEATFVGGGVKPTAQKSDLEIMTPVEVVQKFCDDEKLSDDIKKMGLELLGGCV